MALLFNASDVVDTAIEIERRGQRVYDKAARVASNPNVRRSMQSFAGRAAQHQMIFEAMATRMKCMHIPDKNYEQDYMDYLQALLDSHTLYRGGAPEKDFCDAADAIAAIELASQFSKDTILYLSEMMDLLPAREVHVVKKCFDEQREHLYQLRGLLAKVRKAS